jgi:3'-5' exoribonuclease
MARRYINQLGHQDSVSEIFLVSEKQLRPNRNGNLYLQMELSDRSGAIAARLWNATEGMYQSFDNGDYVRVDATVQVYQGALQMIARNVTRVPATDVDPTDFVPLVSVDVDRLAVRLNELLRGMSSPHLRAIAECFLMDEVLMQKLTRAPAGVKNHHAYFGGLLEHVINLMELVVRVAERFPSIDPDLLLMGAFLHDLGKIDELSYERGFAYTDEGQLIGHVVMAVSMLERKVSEAEALTGEPIPKDVVLRLKHMIVSHHGQYDFGSPKLPMTLEAVALHHLDNLDAKVHSFQQLMKEDPNVDSAWTAYHPTLSRKLYKGKEAAGNEPVVGEG